jgi:hypothetical protein
MTGHRASSIPPERTSGRGSPPGLARVAPFLRRSGLIRQPAGKDSGTPGRSIARRWGSLLRLLLPTSIALAQGPGLSPGDLPGVTIERSATYNGKALYGYIDGGAELYYEYGFRRVVVQEIARDSLRIHLEVFEMDSPAGASGIFSVTRGGCSGKGLWDFECASRFQAQSARGRYFIRAANISGTPAESSMTRAVTRLAASKAGDTLYTPPSLFLDSLFQQGTYSFVIAMGPLGVQNGMAEWTELAEGLADFRLSVLRQEAEGITTTIGLLESPGIIDTAIARRWMEESAPGLGRITLADGPRRLILCETAAGQQIATYRTALMRHRSR